MTRWERLHSNEYRASLATPANVEAGVQSPA